MDDLRTKLETLSPEKRKLLEILLKEKGLLINDNEITAQNRAGDLPLSYSEQRLFFLEQFEPGSPAYVIPAAIRLTGKIKVDILNRSIHEIIRRHEIFRTNYKQEGEKLVRVIRPDVKVATETFDISGDNFTSKNDVINQIIYKESRCPFNLSADMLIRFKLIRISDEENILLIVMHHIVSDNWSTGIFLYELIRIYNAYHNVRGHALGELNAQYADYAIWQRKYLNKDVINKQKSFWKEELEGCSQKLELTVDKLSSPPLSEAKGSFKTFELSENLKLKLNSLCRDEDTTLFMLLITAFEVLLYKYTSQQDFNIGYPIANRNHTGIEHTIGFFVNALILRCRIENKSVFRDLLQKNKVSMLGAFDNQDIPFEMMVEELKLQGETNFTPLFQTMFVLNNAPLNLPALEGLKYELLDVDNGTSKFDLILSLIEDAKVIRGKLEYNTTLFSEEIIGIMIRHFESLLENVCLDASSTVASFSMMDASEKERISFWSAKDETLQSDSNYHLHQIFERQALKTPHNTAIRIDEEAISYSELNKRADRLAVLLIKNGIKPEETVGVYLRRSTDYIVSLLAILKSGGVYVPLDVTYPAERLQYITEDAALKLIITDTSLSSGLSDIEVSRIYLDEENLSGDQALLSDFTGWNYDGSRLAYIIYTSGSTGKPKGVMVEHKSIVEHCLKINSQYEITSEDKILQFASYIFDASIEQIFSALLTGAELIMRGEGIWHTSELASMIKKYGLTIINPPTSYWQQLGNEWSKSNEEISFPSLRLVISGGDVMTPAALSKWQSVNSLKKVKLLNAYGPTETTITATLFEVPENHMTFNPARIPIGRRTSGRRIYILDSEGNMASIGIPGEIFIGGENIARGYHGRPELTAERFIPDNFSNNEGARLYRTGDLGRWLPTGDIEYLGRADEQVKIRGFRIELGEIESIIKKHPLVKDAIVLVKEESGDKKLVAYAIAEGERKPEDAELKSFLKISLPDYMIPSGYVYIERFPLLNSGKVDKKELLKLQIPESIKKDTEYVVPRSSIEATLAELIETSLNREKVGVFDNFFELGGHSMLAMQVVSRIRDEFQVDFPLKTLFEKPSISELSTEIVKLQAEQVDPEVLRQIMLEFKQ